MQSTPPLRMGTEEWAMLIALSVLWGSTFYFVEVGLEGFSPFTLAFGRVFIASLVMLTVLKARHVQIPLGWRFLAGTLVLSMLNNVLPFGLNFWGQTRITASLAAILNATSPLITILLAHFLTRDERITAQKAAGALLGLAGVVILIGPGALDNFGLDVLAQLAILGSAASFCLAAIWARRMMAAPPAVVTSVQVVLSSFILGPIAWFVDRPFERPMPGWEAWGALLGLALLTTVLAYLIYFRLVRSAGATNLSLATLLVPVTAVGLGTAFLGDRLEAQDLAGMALILVGIVVVDGGPLRRLVLLFRS